MKRNLLAFFAVVLAVSVSSFTVKKTTIFYYDFNSGDQNVRSNYTQTTTSPGTVTGANNALDWFSIQDASDNVTTSEWNGVFNALNATNPSGNSLNDEPEQDITVSGQAVHLELKP